MPLYDYLCGQCQHQFEMRRHMADETPPCPACGGPAKKVVLSPPAFHGAMAQGREAAMRSLQKHGPRCPCCTVVPD